MANLNKKRVDAIPTVISGASQKRPELRPIVQITCALGGNSVEASVETARNVVLEWLRDKQRVGGIPEAAWHGGPFEIDVAQDRPVSVEAFENLWAMRYDNPDLVVPGRYWRTEAIIGRTDNIALTGMRLSVISRTWDQPHFRSVPQLVARMVRRPGLTDYGYRLTETAWDVRTEQHVEDLVHLLELGERTRPVFIVSTDQHGDCVIDPDFLAQRTAGLAHVVRLSVEAAWTLSERLGRRLSVFGLAARSYYPGFDRTSARFEDHPLAGVEWLNRRFPDSRSFINFLSDRAVDASIAHADLDQRLPSYARVRQSIASRRLDAAKRAQASDVELTRLYEEDNDQLRDDLKAAEDLLEERSRRQRIVEEERDEFAREVYALRVRVDQLHTALAARGTVETVPTPDNYEDIDDWVQQYVGGSLVLLPRALRAVKKSEYAEPSLVYKALLLLGREYRNLRLGRIPQQALDEALSESGVEISGTGNLAHLMQWREDYEVSWRGTNCFLDMHLKKGTARAPRHCLRIYFFWDQDSEQVIIGHLPDHLTNDLT
jgi:hypothetical protein